MNEQRGWRPPRRAAGAKSGRLAVMAGVVTFAIAATAGCGGGDESSNSSQPLAAFRKQAGPICEEVSKKLAKTELPHTFPAKLKEFDVKSSKVLAVIEAPFTKLAALDPPEGREAAFARFSTALKSAVKETRQLRTLVEARNDDTDALWLPVQNIPTHHGQAMNEATGLRLKSCEELDYKEVSH